MPFYTRRADEGFVAVMPPAEHLGGAEREVWLVEAREEVEAATVAAAMGAAKLLHRTTDGDRTVMTFGHESGHQDEHGQGRGSSGPA